MGNICFKCWVYLKAEDTRVFEPRTASYNENQNDNYVQVLSVRKHKASTSEANIQRENSSQNWHQVEESSHDVGIESNRVDVIKIIGPTGEEEDSIRIISVGEKEDDAGCTQEQQKEEALKRGSTNRHQAEEGPDEVITDDDNDNDDDDDDDNDDGDDDNGDVVKIELQIRDNEQKDESLAGKNLVNLDDDSLYLGRAIDKKIVMYSEKLATLVTKLAIIEAGKYCQENRRDKICRNVLERNENSLEIKHYECTLNSSTKINDCVNDIIRKAIEIFSKELTERTIRKEGFLKSKALMEQKKHIGDVEKIEISSSGTLRIGNPGGTKLAKVNESNQFKEFGNYNTQHSSKMNDIEPVLHNRPLKGAVIDVPSKESVPSPIVCNTKEETAKNLVDYTLNERTRPNFAENLVMKATEIFAQVLVANTIKQAISDVFNANTCLLYKNEGSKKQ